MRYAQHQYDMKYKVTYKETFAKTVEVEAMSELEACEKVRAIYQGHKDVTEHNDQWSYSMDVSKCE